MWSSISQKSRPTTSAKTRKKWERRLEAQDRVIKQVMPQKLKTIEDKFKEIDDMIGATSDAKEKLQDIENMFEATMLSLKVAHEEHMKNQEIFG